MAWITTAPCRRKDIADEENQSSIVGTELVSLQVIVFIYRLELGAHFFFFFLNDPPPTEFYPLPLHAALPICAWPPVRYAIVPLEPFWKRSVTRTSSFSGPLAA